MPTEDGREFHNASWLPEVTHRFSSYVTSQLSLTWLFLRVLWGYFSLSDGSPHHSTFMMLFPSHIANLCRCHRISSLFSCIQITSHFSIITSCCTVNFPCLLACDFLSFSPKLFFLLSNILPRIFSILNGFYRISFSFFKKQTKVFFLFLHRHIRHDSFTPVYF